MARYNHGNFKTVCHEILKFKQQFTKSAGKMN